MNRSLSHLRRGKLVQACAPALCAAADCAPEQGFAILSELSEVPMHRMTRASSCVMVVACLALVAAGAPTPAQSQGAAPPGPAGKLDYEFFKDKVQQVFLTKRPGHARCVVCHTIN